MVSCTIKNVQKSVHVEGVSGIRQDLTWKLNEKTNGGKSEGEEWASKDAENFESDNRIQLCSFFL